MLYDLLSDIHTCSRSSFGMDLTYLGWATLNGLQLLGPLAPLPWPLAPSKCKTTSSILLQASIPLLRSEAHFHTVHTLLNSRQEPAFTLVQRSHCFKFALRALMVSICFNCFKFWRSTVDRVTGKRHSEMSKKPSPSHQCWLHH